MKLAVVFLFAVACGKGKSGGEGSGSSAAPAAPSGSAAAEADDPSSKAAEKWLAVNELRADSKTKTDPAAWPKDDVPGLDFTKETGDAVIVYPEGRGGKDPLTDAPRFKLMHIVDDAYRLAPLAVSTDASNAKYKAAAFRPALGQLARAKYALMVVADTELPKVDNVAKRFKSGELKGVAVLYEIESKKALGGFEVAATNSDKVLTYTGNYTGEELDAVMHDFEKAAIDSVTDGIKKRFPSAKVPPIIYLNSREDDGL
ncbi:MAG: hypothetical protein JWO36_1691 [Myxococcales bacterium]|nr:hypothetical protein [Myxococcales bacterium]